MKLTREQHSKAIRQALATMDTDSLLKCIRYVAAHRDCALCGSARSYLDSALAVESRGNIFYWLENDASLGWLDWLSDTENFCRAIHWLERATVKENQ